MLKLANRLVRRSSISVNSNSFTIKSKVPVGYSKSGTKSGKAAGLSGAESSSREKKKKIPDKPEAFPLFVRLWGSKTKEDAAEGLPEENPAGGFRISLRTV